MDTILLGIGFGVVTGAILALSSVAFTLQYAVSSIPNRIMGENACRLWKIDPKRMGRAPQNR